MAIALDGSGATNSTTLHGATTSATLTLSTSGTDRLVLVFVATEVSGGSAITVSSVTASGLTFAKRKAFSYTSNTSYTGNMEIWWAWASAQLTSAVITVNISGGCDSAVIGAIPLSGIPSANSANPWDTNVSLPATGSNGTSSSVTPSISGISTDNADCMLIGFWSSGNNPAQSISAGSGFSNLLVLGTNSSGAVHDSQGFAEQKVVSAAQSSVAVAFTGSTKWWGAIVDAVTSDTAGSWGGYSFGAVMG